MRCNMLVGSLKNTGNEIFVKSFPMLFFSTAHRLIGGLSSDEIESRSRSLRYPAYTSLLKKNCAGAD